jgi:membrane-associated protease RseP (regulator of RpoE activity)
MKASILLSSARPCRGISATLADASQAPNDNRVQAGIVAGERLVVVNPKLVKQNRKRGRIIFRNKSVPFVLDPFFLQRVKWLLSKTAM